jgi:hypothetical protein
MEFNKIKSKKILNKSKNCFFKTPNIQVWEGNKHGQKKQKATQLRLQL